MATVSLGDQHPLDAVAAALGAEGRQQMLEGRAVTDVGAVDIDDQRAAQGGESTEVAQHGLDVGPIKTSRDRDDRGDTADLGPHPCAAAFDDIADRRRVSTGCNAH
ncbi:MAG: hypothetical protein CK429_33885 [Mycobacterium sp.]|nr:MAG: hypothetical protein CK429_33885 [Mycobacterium sp.]